MPGDHVACIRVNNRAAHSGETRNATTTDNGKASCPSNTLDPIGANSSVLWYLNAKIAVTTPRLPSPFARNCAVAKDRIGRQKRFRKVVVRYRGANGIKD